MAQNTHFETIDMMTGQPPYSPDMQIPAATESLTLRVLASGLAMVATMLCAGMSPDVVAPRTTPSSVVSMPQQREPRNPNSGPQFRPKRRM